MKIRSKNFLVVALFFIFSLTLISFKNYPKNDFLENKVVEKIDLNKFEGKWYSLTSIPTALDKNWRKTVENYSLTDTRFDVLTTYYKIGKADQKSIKSKLFFNADKPNGQMKAQFFWPLKIDYWVIELPDDYSYVVIGHPEKKYLFIMSRKPQMDKKLMAAIVDRCKQKGYDVTKLVSQEH